MSNIIATSLCAKCKLCARARPRVCVVNYMLLTAYVMKIHFQLGRQCMDFVPFVPVQKSNTSIAIVANSWALNWIVCLFFGTVVIKWTSLASGWLVFCRKMSISPSHFCAKIRISPAAIFELQIWIIYPKWMGKKSEMEFIWDRRFWFLHTVQTAMKKKLPTNQQIWVCLESKNFNRAVAAVMQLQVGAFFQFLHLYYGHINKTDKYEETKTKRHVTKCNVNINRMQQLMNHLMHTHTLPIGVDG